MTRCGSAYAAAGKPARIALPSHRSENFPFAVFLNRDALPFLDAWYQYVYRLALTLLIEGREHAATARAVLSSKSAITTRAPSCASMRAVSARSICSARSAASRSASAAARAGSALIRMP